MHGKRRVSVDLAIALGVGLAAGLNQLGRRVELRHQPVCALGSHACVVFTLDCGSNCRTSNIEIIGSKRRNRNIMKMKKPMVPRNVAQSQIVGWYSPHDD